MSDAELPTHVLTQDSDSLPTVYLPEPDGCVELLQRLQAVVLRHPIAAKAAFSALVAEGRAFARTPEGQDWQEKLAGSELLHRARLVLDLPGLSIVESTGPQTLPSAYLDTIFSLACSRQPGALLDRLFEWGSANDRG